MMAAVAIDIGGGGGSNWPTVVDLFLTIFFPFFSFLYSLLFTYLLTISVSLSHSLSIYIERCTQYTEMGEERGQRDGVTGRSEERNQGGLVAGGCRCQLVELHGGGGYGSSRIF